MPTYRSEDAAGLRVRAGFLRQRILIVTFDHLGLAGPAHFLTRPPERRLKIPTHIRRPRSERMPTPYIFILNIFRSHTSVTGFTVLSTFSITSFGPAFELCLGDRERLRVAARMS